MSGLNHGVALLYGVFRLITTRPRMQVASLLVIACGVFECPIDTRILSYPKLCGLRVSRDRKVFVT